ncbi:hypothetical protein HELRODRAFT_79619 [Helobdella robusta]|uniref:SRP54-type proteins GTP-binding domain-containing protein n=1 Tax=Helobdella robusta TaxID=6412 RepID=T1G3R2_HELRO|nr:hypothetical protein HELRODRAFT_79619 [Helobdella robusta]ESO03981.1 hypothetical protein HELRODRAFT_79619 [Helobdella robusta]
MLDLFTIFSKGGIVLWCFQGTAQSLTSSVNALIKSVILQERGGLGSFTHESLSMKYKLDNEFELVFVIGYQNFLQLSYVDKFLNDIQMEFRNRYKDELHKNLLCLNLDGFTDLFHQKLKACEKSAQTEKTRFVVMKTFDESVKSQKTVASMIEKKKDDKKTAPKKEPLKPLATPPASPPTNQINGVSSPSKLKKFSKMNAEKKSSSTDSKVAGKKVKEGRTWGNGGSMKDAKDLDFSDVTQNGDDANKAVVDVDERYDSMAGQLKEYDDGRQSSSDDDDVDGGGEEVKTTMTTKKKSAFGLFDGLKNLVGSKVLTKKDIEPAMEKMKDHLIAKNVAAEIAGNLCESVITKLEGKVLGTFKTVASTVKQALEESCVQLLTPRKRIDILRDALDAQAKRKPYVVVFCGVNGVGKSTNLAKICYWLIENNLRVLIAACDTFRAGAVEQLRTHCRKLNAIHHSKKEQIMAHLYEKGYGKDAAGVAMEAINYARDFHFDVVLVDTAGRMQGNEPLMKSLAKLIKWNQPDLVLFVGEALVGNDAVDQLVKFNQALADFSDADDPHLIDGIVLTKFDTIDDKVGAAISMTYITGQPIVFVGTGQTYCDLKNLNARSVVHSLLKS